MPHNQLKNESRLQQVIARLKSSVAKQREMIKVLRANLKDKNKEIATLKDKLEDKEAQRQHLLKFMYKPGKKPGNETEDDEQKKNGRAKRKESFHRPKPKPEAVTEEHTFSLKKCPMCRHEVSGVVDEVTKYEEDIILAPRVTVKKFTITRHWCGHCETYVKSPDIPPISRIGLNVLGYILYARYRLRLPVEKIKESPLDLHNFRISKGEISEKLSEAGEIFGKDHDAICELIKDASVVYADETGWRMDGCNWWLWVFVTAKGVRYMLDQSRGKGIPNAALGEKKKDRVIVSDGFAVYAKLTGDKQQCWVHLLRAAREATGKIYADLVTLYLKIGEALKRPLKERGTTAIDAELRRI